MSIEELPKKVNKLTVSVSGNELGLLTHGSVHQYQPTQTERYVSLTMTKPSLDSYTSGALHPIFSQNLPEGFNRRYIAEKLARHAKVNDMYLLALQGDNSVGMLSYQGDIKLPESSGVTLTEILSYTGPEPLFPQLLEKYYLRNSLAGVQPKISLPKTDRTLEQKDLIVKSFDSEFPLLTVNEYVCMEAARYCGLEPPQTYLSNNLETFIIERFDQPEGLKLGYEDFTTLLKKPNSPDAKYTGSYENLMLATLSFTNDFSQVKKLYQYIVFNCLIGNGDAHLKNYALQYTPDMTEIFLSPIFDVTHTLIYDSIDNKMALKIAGSKVFPNRQDLLKLANSAHCKIRHADEIIDSTAQGILDFLTQDHTSELQAGLKESIIKAVNVGASTRLQTKGYRHDKKRKYE